MNERYCRVIDRFCAGEILRDKKKAYYGDFITFDIETTNIKRLQQSVMYLGAIHICGHTYFMRTWKDVRKFFFYLNQKSAAKVVCFVHNLAFEFQFMRGVFDFGKDNVFLLDQRKPIKALFNNIEFRCSYILTNMSLSLFLKTMNVKNKKLAGYNYNKYRYPWSQLTWLDYRYNGNDVIGLYQALRRFLDMNGDTVLTTPLTSTGFVRRDIKNVLSENVNTEHLKRIQPTIPILEMLREAFRGGDTHENRFYYGELLKDVGSVDEKSAYPAVMTCCPVPWGEFNYLGHISAGVADRKIKNGFALLMRVAMYDVTLKDDFNGSPYLSFSKCRNVQNYVLDNGRIWECDYLETTITDVDYRILKEDYNFELVIVEAYQSQYKMLPQCVRDEIMTYFYNKEMLKHSNPDLYIKSKNKLNSIYGMCVRNPLKQEFMFDSSDNEYHIKAQDFTKIYEDLVKAKFIPYQAGVWITSWARFRLHLGKKCLNDSLDFVYCDTDSIYFVNVEENKKNFDKLNEKLKQIAIDNNAYFIDENGEGHYLGIFEFEKECSQFISLGAKKYCYRLKDDHKLHLTLAGVSKSGVKELSNNIRNFKEGFIFKKSAGLKAKYNDHVDFKTKIDGHELRITSNVYLEKTTYEINLTEDYDQCIQIAKKLLHNK